ncbi:hypothetical protein COV13_00080 [Candidatus Woesearchaeota archaeon CG10_big_fil_rev_8_21_14_0_10_32_9]|nr:MAG: hypothetical protein COV13_00080 [Candidatus Woesearchaeota archaeon CG10_big_fil_rev_8_21_14_0_10_32_9]
MISDEIKKKIIDKKELSGLKPDFLNSFLEKYFLKNKNALTILEQKNFNERSKEFKELKKNIRKKLREVHGVFNKNKSTDRTKTIKELNVASTFEKKEHLLDFLKNHQSTKERINSYIEIYTQVFEQKNLRVLDLGCGFNPLFFLLLPEKISCVAIDINSEELDLLSNMYSAFNKKIEAHQLDLTESSTLIKVSKLSKKTNITLMLKLLDSLETKNRGTTTKLLEQIQSEFLLISFATKSIGGNKKINGSRKWFKRAISKSRFTLEKEFETQNEKYLLFKQKNS